MCCPGCSATSPTPLRPQSVRVSGEVPATWFPVVPCCSARVEQSTERMRSSVGVVLLSGVDRTVSRTVGVSADGSTGSS